MRAWPLLLLAACGTPNPLSSAQEGCRNINAAAERYNERCAVNSVMPYDLCDKVIDSHDPPASFQECIDQIDAAACGSITNNYPAVCPKHWVLVPGL